MSKNNIEKLVEILDSKHFSPFEYRLYGKVFFEKEKELLTRIDRNTKWYRYITNKSEIIEKLSLIPDIELKLEELILKNV